MRTLAPGNKQTQPPTPASQPKGARITLPNPELQRLQDAAAASPQVRRQASLQAIASESVVQRDIWDILRPVTNWFGGFLGHGDGAAAVPAPPVAVAGPVINNVRGSAQAKADAQPIRHAINQISDQMNQAPRALTHRIDNQFPNSDPTYDTNDFFPILNNLINNGIADNAEMAAATADRDRLAAHLVAYQTFIANIDGYITNAMTTRARYRTQMQVADVTAFQTIVNHVYNFDCTAAQIGQRCTQFITGVKASSVVTGVALEVLANGNGVARAEADALVQAYFNDDRLRIGRLTAIYASDHDKVKGAFGAEFDLAARDQQLTNLARYWVFHTHGYAIDPQTFAIKRAIGANHIKPRANPQGQTRINFHAPGEFDRVERNRDAQGSFAGRIKRDEANILGHKGKR